MDSTADPRAAHGGPKTQQELAALWLQMLQMPPPQLAQCLMVHTLTAPEGHPFPMRPAVRVVLPGIPKYADFTDVLLGILTLLVSDHGRYVHDVQSLLLALVSLDSSHSPFASLIIPTLRTHDEFLKFLVSICYF